MLRQTAQDKLLCMDCFKQGCKDKKKASVPGFICFNGFHAPRIYSGNDDCSFCKQKAVILMLFTGDLENDVEKFEALMQERFENPEEFNRI